MKITRREFRQLIQETAAESNYPEALRGMPKHPLRVVMDRAKVLVKDIPVYLRTFQGQGHQAVKQIMKSPVGYRVITGLRALTTAARSAGDASVPIILTYLRSIGIDSVYWNAATREFVLSLTGKSGAVPTPGGTVPVEPVPPGAAITPWLTIAALLAIAISVPAIFLYETATYQLLDRRIRYINRLYYDPRKGANQKELAKGDGSAINKDGAVRIFRSDCSGIVFDTNSGPYSQIIALLPYVCSPKGTPFKSMPRVMPGVTPPEGALDMATNLIALINEGKLDGENLCRCYHKMFLEGASVPPIEEDPAMPPVEIVEPDPNSWDYYISYKRDKDAAQAVKAGWEQRAGSIGDRTNPRHPKRYGPEFGDWQKWYVAVKTDPEIMGTLGKNIGEELLTNHILDIYKMIDSGTIKEHNMKITKARLRQIIQEEIQKEYGYGRRVAPSRPDYGEGNLTIKDVQELFPSLSPGEQADIWDKYKHLNNAGELKAAILGL